MFNSLEATTAAKTFYATCAISDINTGTTTTLHNLINTIQQKTIEGAEGGASSDRSLYTRSDARSLALDGETSVSGSDAEATPS